MGGCNRRGRMSENEKAIFFMILFPIFWPFIPVVLICMACEKIAQSFREWRRRRSGLQKSTSST